MKFKNIHVIINPVAGNHESILTHLNTIFTQHKINWMVSVTTDKINAFDITSEHKEKFDLIVVNGGDGSVSEVARALFKSNTPMAIIPGGTANVMAKELNIPLEPEAAISLIVNNKSRLLKVDMGKANGTPFLIRINFGIMADMISKTDNELKDTIGQLAYGVTTLQSLIHAEPVAYHLTIDGKQTLEKSVALTITNAGSIGISDFSLLPNIRVTDGYLDVIILHDISLFSLLKVAGTTLFQTDSEVLKHFRCKLVKIRTDHLTDYLCDDETKQSRQLTIQVIPKALKILVPPILKL